MKIKHVDIPTLLLARKAAKSYEEELSGDRCKELGQFFTGLPLSRLLTALSVRKHCRTIIDPMAGTGDLLDAVFERCAHRKIALSHVDSIEIDVATAEMCKKRLSPWLDIASNVRQQMQVGSAFDPNIVSKLKTEGYDLVITNPPYVRYQTVSRNGSTDSGHSINDIRCALLEIADKRVPVKEQALWKELIRWFSGLSDLSVPSWLLSAMLVKPGGVLALVAPATWRTRDYADVLLYMLARFFRLDSVVADKQPGWFSKALVRTHLVVATRLSSDDVCTPLQDRKSDGKSFGWAEIDPDAKGGDSLVGTAFPSDDSEFEFSRWMLGQRHVSDIPRGVRVNKRLHADENADVLSRCRRASWFHKAEPIVEDEPLFCDVKSSGDNIVPPLLSDALGYRFSPLDYLKQLGINVSQGLRTGCNDFFYVDLLELVDDQFAKVRVSDLFEGMCLTVPKRALETVLRRQSEVMAFKSGKSIVGRVLDLRQYVLPEDYPEVERAKPLYRLLKLQQPAIMPDELADHVRRAAITRRGKKGSGELIPNLSAVKTNVRQSKDIPRPQIPRFWYMLPDFVRRHRPNAFIPRINQQTPVSVPNISPPILIDANFSTVWTENSCWTTRSIVALLNSSWSRACMEAIGTPMGGGALKLEATHLRRLPVPIIDDKDIKRLELHYNFETSQAQDVVDQIIVGAVLRGTTSEQSVWDMILRLRDFRRITEKSRQRG